MSSNSQPSSAANWLMWGRRLLSAGPFSSATRIFLYMRAALTRLTRQPRREPEVIRKEFQIQTDDNARRDPRKALDPLRIDELPHFLAIARKCDQRHDGKWQLKAQDDLTQH